MYSEYTTKGHGVIEGPRGGRHGAVGAVYGRRKAIPNTHLLHKTVSSLSDVSSRISEMYPSRQEELNHDLQVGYIVRIAGDIYLKHNKYGNIEVYIDVSKPIKKTKDTYLKKDQGAHDLRVKSAYEELMQIHLNAKRERNQKHH